MIIIIIKINKEVTIVIISSSGISRCLLLSFDSRVSFTRSANYKLIRIHVYISKYSCLVPHCLTYIHLSYIPSYRVVMDE